MIVQPQAHALQQLQRLGVCPSTAMTRQLDSAMLMCRMALKIFQHQGTSHARLALRSDSDCASLYCHHKFSVLEAVQPVQVCL